MDKIKLMMTDDAGHFWLEGKLYKIKKWRAGTKEERLKGIHRAEYVEVNPEEYDARIEKMTKELSSQPGVDLKDVLRDALYDISLDHLERLEKSLAKEKQKEQPKVATKRGERGTCVELRIGGHYGLELRA